MVQPIWPTSFDWTRYYGVVCLPNLVAFEQHLIQCYTNWCRNIIYFEEKGRDLFLAVRRSRPHLFWGITLSRESIWSWSVEMLLAMWFKAFGSSWENFRKYTVDVMTLATLALRDVEMQRPARSEMRWMACLDWTADEEILWRSGIVMVWLLGIMSIWATWYIRVHILV